MSEFVRYIRTQEAEMRPVNLLDIAKYEKHEKIEYNDVVVSISQADKKNGSPRKGDMIARNPKNHDDVWLVAEDYFKENFEKKSETK